MVLSVTGMLVDLSVEVMQVTLFFNYAVRNFCRKCVGGNFYCNYADGSLCCNYAGSIFAVHYAHDCFYCNYAGDSFIACW